MYSAKQRAKELIGIAYPDFRSKLTETATSFNRRAVPASGGNTHRDKGPVQFVEILVQAAEWMFKKVAH